MLEINLTQKDIDRFYSHIITDWKNCPDDCWKMDYTPDRNGHYNIGINNTPHKAHRISYYIYNGKIPNDLLIRHTCNNPSCVNPNHLLPGTVQDNSDDMVAANRQAKGTDVFGSKLTDDIVRCILTDIYNGRYDGQSATYISKIYNVNYIAIMRILRGLTWTHITNQLIIPLSDLYNRIVDPDCPTNVATLLKSDVVSIKLRLQNGEVGKHIAKLYNVSPATIYRIRDNKTWKHVII